MDQQKLEALAAFTDDLMKCISTLQAGTPALIKETIKAREDLFTIVEPAAKQTGAQLADDARAAHSNCNALNEKILFLATKVDSIVKVHRGAMDKLSYVGYELSLVEEKRRELTSEDGVVLLNFQRAHKLAKAEWELYSSVAIIQLHSLLGPYHELLLAFSGKKPGKHLDFQAAGKEIGDKLADAAKDYLVFPFFAKLQKLINVLLMRPSKKQAQELLRTVPISAKIDAFNRGIASLDPMLEYVEQMIDESGRDLLESTDRFEGICETLLAKLRGDQPA